MINTILNDLYYMTSADLTTQGVFFSIKNFFVVALAYSSLSPTSKNV